MAYLDRLLRPAFLCPLPLPRSRTRPSLRQHLCSFDPQTLYLLFQRPLFPDRFGFFHAELGTFHAGFLCEDGLEEGDVLGRGLGGEEDGRPFFAQAAGDDERLVGRDQYRKQELMGTQRTLRRLISSSSLSTETDGLDLVFLASGVVLFFCFPLPFGWTTSTSDESCAASSRSLL